MVDKPKESDLEEEEGCKTPSNSNFTLRDEVVAGEDVSLKIVQEPMSHTSSGASGDGEDEVVLRGSWGNVTRELVELGDANKNIKKEKKIEKEVQSVDVVIEEEKLSEHYAVDRSDNVVLRQLLRGPRYFDPPDSRWGTCYNCGEEGHAASNCKSAKRKKPCFVCGSFEHGAKQCQKSMQGQGCFICKISGHFAKDCSAKLNSSNQGSNLCLKCGSHEHAMISCTDNYSSDDMKGIQCYVCKSFGHLSCANYIGALPSEVSCYKCGQLGHSGLACKGSQRGMYGEWTPNSCFKCGEEGHFARECESAVKVKKWRHASSNPKKKANKEGKSKGYKSAPQDPGKNRKKRKIQFDEDDMESPTKRRKRGGWIMDDTGERPATPHKPIPPPPPPVTFPATVFSALDDLINNFVDPPVRPSVDPRHVLAGNFAPVDELSPTKCEIIGRLPPCLDGAYIRNGPNPQFLPRGPYHLFDGDGMLHCLRISHGGTHATLSSRYVQTNKFKAERRVGTPVIPNVFSCFHGLTASAARSAVVAARVAAGQFNPLDGIGLANTSLALIAGRLYALNESDLPYEVSVTQDGDVVTLGRSDLNGELVMSMTAHPKLDPITRETFGFRYSPIPPFLTYFRIDAYGKKIGPDVPVFSLTRPSFLHDFAITENHAIFNDIQIGMDPAGLVLRGGSPVASDSNKVPRIGVMPRYANDESGIRWFDVPGFNLIHTINAWAEIDPVTQSESIVLIAPNIMSVEHTLERLELIHAQVEKLRIDLDTGHVSRVPLSTRNLDFSVINQNRLGRKNRFVYAAVGDPMPKISGVVKLDLEVDRKECTVAERMFGERCYGGEPFFVSSSPEENDVDEDDGYLVSYVHDEKTNESKFIVMDTKSPELEVVAEVRLPQRVPYGFHGIFVREKDLCKAAA